MTLHIVSASPYDSAALADAVRAAGDGDALLLAGDGTYAALARAGEPARLLRDASANGVRLHALLPDVEVRGLAGRLHGGILLVDDEGFVALTEHHLPVITWF